MLSKIKNFIKYNSLACIYLIFFIISQSVALMGLFVYYVMNDESFQMKFVELMGPIYNNPNLNYLESYDEITNAYMELVNELIIPILFVSNLLIVIVIGLKIFLNRKKETVIKKISLNEAFKYALFGVLLNLIISLIISLLPASLIESHSSATESVLTGNVWLLLITSGILAPIAEEFICRYGMQKNLIKINVVFGIAYQALVFGMLHGNLVQSTYAFVLGLIFGIVVYRKENLLYSIILHLSINTSSVVISCIEIPELLGMGIIIIVLGILTLITMKMSKKVSHISNMNEDNQEIVLEDFNEKESE